MTVTALPDTLTVRNQWFSGVQLDQACTRITGGPSLDVQSGGDLTFRSVLVELVDGFAVKTGGQSTADSVTP